ncbi:MAG TPA: thiamine diphosphokinase [Bdellovibrionota bacterium]|nr:thiamine diphosphokinase [Bdellovibrionota bacterium]
MRILVALDAPIQDYTSIRKQLPRPDFVIAADGAVRHLSPLGLKPDQILGDFDTLTKIPDEYKEVEIIRYSMEKDATNGALAIDHAIKRSPSSIDFVGITGGLLDHTIANIKLLINLPPEINITVYNERETVYRITESLSVETNPETVVSLVAVQGDPSVTTSGLKYPIEGERLRSPTHGISNQAISKTVSISVAKGEGVLFAFFYLNTPKAVFI